MAGGVLRPEDVGPADAARVLAFLNGVDEMDAFAETIGLADGIAAGRRVAAAILAARDAGGAFRSLGQVLAVTGVNLDRFTQIVMALSSARPAPEGARLRMLPTTLTPWLGQQVVVAVQLLDASGLGIPAARITCIASDGVLSAREGLETQTGAAVSLGTEPGGIVRFTFGPRIDPALSLAEQAALTAALRRVAPDAAAKGLAEVAALYRQEGNAALRSAVDRLFDIFRAEAQHPLAPWPVRPVSLIALAEGEGGTTQVVATVTLRLRNWLGAFHGALRDAVEADGRLGAALKNLDRAAEAGGDLSRQIYRATQGFAGLERGVLGQKLRDVAAGKAVASYLDSHAATLKGAAVANSVRAAGAASAAIASGGFAVFEAIRSVQDAGTSVTSPKGSDLGSLRKDLLTDIANRFEGIREPEVDRADLDALRGELTREFDTRFLQIPQGVTRADLDGLRTSLTRELDAKLAEGVGRADLDALKGEITRDLDTRFSQLPEGLTRADLESLRTSVTREFDAKLEAIPRRTSQADLDALRADLTRTIDSRFAGLPAAITKDDMEALRADLDRSIAGRFAAIPAEATAADLAALRSQIANVETSLNAKIDTKADTRTVVGLQTSVTQVQTDRDALATRVNTLDQRLVRVEPQRPIR